MQPHVPIIFSKSVVLCALAATAISCKKTEETAKPEYRALTEAVYASGTLSPRSEYKVYAMADGVITRRMVDEGNAVKAGEVLFRIDNEEQAARMNAARDVFRTAESNYKSSSPALEEAEAALRSARSKLATDSVQFSRVSELYASKAMTQADYDRAKLTLQVSQNDFSAAKQRAERTKRQLYVDLQNAESQFKVSAKQESNALVKSSTDAMVYELYKQQGEAVRRNDPLALLGSPNEVYIKLSVDELDIQKIQIGQEVLVKIDIYQDRTFKAKVEKVYPMLTKQDQSFRVDAAFIEALPARFVGVTAEANIVISRKERALVIPKALVLKGDSVLVKNADGTTAKVKIRKGAETFDVVEILSGLSDSSQLVVKK
jgi:multidrug resistance efflux pump